MAAHIMTDPPLCLTVGKRQSQSRVEYSIESGFKVGMKLEVPNPDDRTTYWPASVIMTCGDLLTLRYVGYGDDRSADFWFNIKSGEFHPIGWCSRNSKNLSPPKDVLRKCTNVNNILSKELNNCDTISEAISENIDGGFIPIDQIKCGMKLELMDEYNAKNVWIVTIAQNIGGRLLLTYDGCEETSSFNIWLFYLSDRLNPVGFAKLNNMQYSPPEGMKNQHTEEEWKIILNRSFEDAEKLPFPSHIFEPKIPLEKHAFKLGMKLEAVNPQNYAELCPATVTKIVDDCYFLVKIDEYPAEQEKKCCMCCSSNTPFIFPVKWAEEHELELKTPKGYEPKKSKFSWDDYLQFCNAVSAPADFFPMCFMNMGFETNMKLEAADPFNSNNIHAATITKIMEPLMWLEFDDRVSDQKSLIYSVNSYDIYPVGWCASNSYSLHTPTVYKSKAKSNPVLETPKIIEKIPQEVPILSINEHLLFQFLPSWFWFQEEISLNLFPFFVFALWRVFPLSTTYGPSVSWLDLATLVYFLPFSIMDHPPFFKFVHNGGAHRPSEERLGEDPLKWLKEYDRVANFNKWDDMMCLANVYFFLTELRDSGMSTTKTP
ncbi:scm-like with four MBT domains protein 2 [Trichonephila clavipes]|nr:scm-like with four MBT domains protein 2 [Trichonephila clavipes]